MEKYKQISNTLKACSINRILLDMIRETRSQIDNATFLVLIVDDYSSKILSSFLTMTEVLNEGVFSIERLSLLRQKFPKYHGLYFLSPTSESVLKLVDDFADPNKPQHARAHIFFTHRLMDLTLEKMLKEPLVKRVKTLKELNLSFHIKDRDLFDLNLNFALEIFTVKNNLDQRDKILSNILERLFTVCASLNEYPYIQVQKSSSLCLKLGEMLNVMLTDFYQIKNFNEKRGILLLTDRTYDVTTPFLHDYSYEALVYDFFNLKENKIIVEKINYILDDKDEFWIKNKNKHIVKVFDEIQKEIKEFGESDISKAHKGELETFDEMLNVVHGMKGYEKKSKQLSMHVKLCEEIMTVY